MTKSNILTMFKFILALLLITVNISYCQISSNPKPDIFYISIGSCVYSKHQLTGTSASLLFPEKIDIKNLMAGFEKDFIAYENDPKVIRRKDSLDTILHEVTWDQQERAHDFVQTAMATDSFPGDKYINRCDGQFRIKKMTISGSDTVEQLEPPFLVDTLSQDIGSYFDSTDFKGAKKSAALVSNLLNKRGAIGFTISSYESPISRNMFFAAIDSLWTIIQKAHKPNPMIIFYYCGHGYADGLGRRFLVPGTFSGALNKMPIESRRLRSVFIKDLYKYLELSGYPFIIFLDCCSDNQADPPNEDINDYYKQMAINLDGIELVRTVYQQFFQPTGDAVVMYSSVLGSNSVPVPDPVDTNSYTYVGPLCRRLQIAERKYKDLFLSFQNMQKIIMNKNLDKITKTPGIYCNGCGGPLLPISK